MTKEQIYKKNQKRAKVFKTIAPVVFWVMIALSVIMFLFAIRHSIGNIAEIVDLLDSKKFNGVQLQEHYNYLIEKYGEWIIGNGNNGFVLTFINIGNAVFSGVAVLSSVFSLLFLIGAYVLGKWILPTLSAQITQQNQDMVNITVLQKMGD